MLFKDMMKKIRESLVMDQKEFAQVLGISPSTYWHYENGTHKPRTKVLRKIIDICKKNNLKFARDDFFVRED